MKSKIYLIILAFITLSSCERVIDLDLETAKPRLVVDAAIDWKKGTPGNEQTIYLRTTSGYFANEIPTVSNAIVYITRDNLTFDFLETEPGTYFCATFVPEIDATYELTVITNDQTYTATETLKAVPVLGEIQQNNEGGFTGDNIEIKVFFTDNGATNDYYLSTFKPDFTVIPDYGVVEDRFFQGNTIFAIYSDEDLISGSVVDFRLSGISQRYYNYLNILLSIAGSNGGSPFSSPSSTVRGNIVNTTSPKKYALGYFSVSESTSTTYVVE